MDFSSHLSPILTCLVLFLSLYFLWQRKTHGLKSKGKSPPEPSVAWPIIGHLHLFRGKAPVARRLGSLADKIGPIFCIQLGANRALVISSWEAVKDCFTKNDRVFATRAPSTTGKYLAYNYAAFGLAPYGNYWRDMKKIVMVELLSTRRLETLKHLRTYEVQESIKELYCSFNNGDHSPIKMSISKWLKNLALNMIVKTISGKRYSNSLNGLEDEEAENFRRVVKEFTSAAAEFQVYDQIPLRLFEWIDFTGTIKNMKRVLNDLDNIFQNWIDEHENKRLNKELNKEQDFIYVMLSVIDNKITYGYTRETIIKATILILILASADTSYVLLTWITALLLNNKHVMKRAQEEIERNIGNDRWVEESDIDNLIYLQAIVKETLRLYPPGPVLVPHQAMEDCNVGDYFISKGTHLIVNAWKLHRDPRIWQKPEEFWPERFLTTNAQVDVNGQNFEYIPFGSGRRSCPGTGYAIRATHLIIARLIQGFNLATPSNLPVDMKEGLGLLLVKEKPLEVLISPRLPAPFYGN